MINEVEKWLTDNNLTSRNSVIGQCENVCHRIIKDMPELNLALTKGLLEVKMLGFPNDPPRKSNHWWLKTKDGEIVDPTKHQFQTKTGNYFEAEEGKEPTGKCQNCGGLCYNHATTCSDKCSKEFNEYIMKNSEPNQDDGINKNPNIIVDEFLSQNQPNCIHCKSDKMKDEDFRNEISRKERDITLNCQKCQDEIFGID